MNKKKGAGFTLIELLMVVSMLSIVSLAVFSTFNNGIKIWQRVNKQSEHEEVNIFLEKLSRDIRNTFIFSGIDFTGTEEKAAFPGIVNNKGLGVSTIGRVTYAYDQVDQSITRSQEDFSQVAASGPAAAARILGNVSLSRFQYYYFDPQKREYLWSNEWNGPGLPLALRVEFGNSHNGRKTEYTRSIFIPVSF